MARSLAQADREAQGIVRKWAVVAAPVGMIPGSPFLLPGLDAKLISDVAKCYEVHNYTIDAVLAVVGASIAGRTAADIGLSTIPVAGWIVKGFVAGGVTYTAGKAMMAYFREKSDLS